MEGQNATIPGCKNNLANGLGPLSEPKGEILFIYFQFRKTKPELQVLCYSLSMIIITVVVIIIKNKLGRNASSLKKILHLDKMLTLKGSSGWAELQENTALTVLLLCCSEGKLNIHDRQHCVLSQCKYNSCQFSSLQSSQDGFSQHRTPLTAACQCYCNRSLHPE